MPLLHDHVDDAVRANAKEDEVRVMDLSQLFEESLLTPAAPAPEASQHRGLSTGRQRPQRG